MVVEVEKLKDNLYVMKGGGGNSAVFIGTDGVTVVDTKNPGWGTPLLEKIKSVTDKPVVRIINTHTHGDHVSGNVEFPATVDVVVQENTKAGMEAMRPVTGLAAPPPGPSIFEQNNGKGLPKRTFKDTMTIGKGADQIDLYYFGPAHTGGDAFVVFRRASRHARRRRLPDARPADHGQEQRRQRRRVLRHAGQGGATLKNVDMIINGHNPTTTTMADLKTQSEFIADFVKFVQDARRRARRWTRWRAAGRRRRNTPATPHRKRARVRADAQVIWDETK